MKLGGVLPLAVLLASSSAISQQSANLATLATFSQPRPTDPVSCPVGLNVKHGPMMEKRVVDHPGPGQDSRMALPTVGQRIILSLDNLRSLGIVRVRFTARGLGPEARYVSLAGDPSAATLSKSIELAVAVQANGHASRDVALERFAAVTAVDVDAVTYADGSTWRSLVASACSAKPEMIMLLSAEK